MCIFSRDLTPIGIDLGSRYVKAAQLSRSRGRWRVQAAAVIPLGMPQSALTVEALVRFRVQLKTQGFTGKQVVLAAPNSKLDVEMLDPAAEPARSPEAQRASCWAASRGPRGGIRARRKT